jgi:hypothetical protein
LELFSLPNVHYAYFLNAVHYCLYLGGKWSMKKVDNGVLRIVHYLSVLFSFESFYNKKVDERKKGTELWDYMYGKDWGVSISSAHHWFGYFYSSYSIFLSFALLGIPDGMFGGVSTTVAIAIIALPIGLCYIPAYKAVFSKDRYLKYFKQFEKEDEQWHKKWNRITWVFCIGSVVFTIGGIFAMWGVSLLFRK